MAHPSLVAQATLFAVLAAACSDSQPTNGSESAAFLRPAQANPQVPAVTPLPLAAEQSVPRDPVENPDVLSARASDSSQSGQPLPVAARTRDAVALERDAENALKSGDGAGASAMYSDLLLSTVSGTGTEDRAALARWSAALTHAQRGYRWNKRGAWPSIDVDVQAGDSLTAIRKRVLSAHPELLICTGLIARANELSDERAIHPKDKLRVPTDRVSMLVDLSAMWAFYLHADQVVAAWEVGVGKESSHTRPGRYVIGTKQREPMWFPKGRAPVPFGDPQNPLGTRWLAWRRENGAVSLGFHGTGDPNSVGQRVSEGCIRMRNEDVEALFEILPEGATVLVQP